MIDVHTLSTIVAGLVVVSILLAFVALWLSLELRETDRFAADLSSRIELLSEHLDRRIDAGRIMSGLQADRIKAIESRLSAAKSIVELDGKTLADINDRLDAIEAELTKPKSDPLVEDMERELELGRTPNGYCWPHRFDLTKCKCFPGTA